MSALGIIAGGGDLPLAVAESAIDAGRKVFIAALQGSTDTAVVRFPHSWVSLGEVGKIFKLFRTHDCSDVLLAGKVARPKFSEVKVDAKGALAAPKVIAAARKGDDALLRSLVDIISSAGFRVVGVAEAAPGLLASAGALGRLTPMPEQLADIVVAARVVRQMGAFDIGQAAVVCDNLILAVEAAEGTDAMIARVGTLPEHIRGTPAKRRGVLVKAPKPMQNGTTDLPVIGVQSVKNAAAVGLAGIAVEAGTALIINRGGVKEAADQVGLFVFGFSRDLANG